MSQDILQFLKTRPRGATLLEIEEGTGRDLVDLAGDLFELVNCHWVQVIPGPLPQRYTTVPKTGDCDVCAIWDGALVAGLCGSCLNKSTDLQSGGQPQ